MVEGEKGSSGSINSSDKSSVSCQSFPKAPSQEFAGDSKYSDHGGHLKNLRRFLFYWMCVSALRACMYVHHIRV